MHRLLELWQSWKKDPPKSLPALQRTLAEEAKHLKISDKCKEALINSFLLVTKLHIACGEDDLDHISDGLPSTPEEFKEIIDEIQKELGDDAVVLLEASYARLHGVADEEWMKKLVGKRKHDTKILLWILNHLFPRSQGELDLILECLGTRVSKSFKALCPQTAFMWENGTNGSEQSKLESKSCDIFGLMRELIEAEKSALYSFTPSVETDILHRIGRFLADNEGNLTANMRDAAKAMLDVKKGASSTWLESRSESLPWIFEVFRVYLRGLQELMRSKIQEGKKHLSKIPSVMHIGNPFIPIVLGKPKVRDDGICVEEYIQAGNFFRGLGEYSLALELFEKGSKLDKGTGPANLNLPILVCKLMLKRKPRDGVDTPLEDLLRRPDFQLTPTELHKVLAASLMEEIDFRVIIDFLERRSDHVHSCETCTCALASACSNTHRNDDAKDVMKEFSRKVGFRKCFCELLYADLISDDLWKVINHDKLVAVEDDELFRVFELCMKGNRVDRANEVLRHIKHPFLRAMAFKMLNQQKECASELEKVKATDVHENRKNQWLEMRWMCSALKGYEKLAPKDDDMMSSVPHMGSEAMVSYFLSLDSRRKGNFVAKLPRSKVATDFWKGLLCRQEFRDVSKYCPSTSDEHLLAACACREAEPDEHKLKEYYNKNQMDSCLSRVIALVWGKMLKRKNNLGSAESFLRNHRNDPQCGILFGESLFLGGKRKEATSHLKELINTVDVDEQFMARVFLLFRRYRVSLHDQAGVLSRMRGESARRALFVVYHDALEFARALEAYKNMSERDQNDPDLKLLQSRCEVIVIFKKDGQSGFFSPLEGPGAKEHARVMMIKADNCGMTLVALKYASFAKIWGAVVKLITKNVGKTSLKDWMGKGWASPRDLLDFAMHLKETCSMEESAIVDVIHFLLEIRDENDIHAKVLVSFGELISRTVLNGNGTLDVSSCTSIVDCLISGGSQYETEVRSFIGSLIEVLKELQESPITSECVRWILKTGSQFHSPSTLLTESNMSILSMHVPLGDARALEEFIDLCLKMEALAGGMRYFIRWMDRNMSLHRSIINGVVENVCIRIFRQVARNRDRVVAQMWTHFDREIGAKFSQTDRLKLSILMAYVQREGGVDDFMVRVRHLEESSDDSFESMRRYLLIEADKTEHRVVELVNRCGKWFKDGGRNEIIEVSIIGKRINMLEECVTALRAQGKVTSAVLLMLLMKEPSASLLKLRTKELIRLNMFERALESLDGLDQQAMDAKVLSGIAHGGAALFASSYKKQNEHVRRAKTLLVPFLGERGQLNGYANDDEVVGMVRHVLSSVLLFEGEISKARDVIEMGRDDIECDSADCERRLVHCAEDAVRKFVLQSAKRLLERKADTTVGKRKLVHFFFQFAKKMERSERPLEAAINMAESMERVSPGMAMRDDFVDEVVRVFDCGDLLLELDEASKRMESLFVHSVFSLKFERALLILTTVGRGRELLGAIEDIRPEGVEENVLIRYLRARAEDRMENVVEKCNEALEMDMGRKYPEILVLKGRSLYSLGKYRDAHRVLIEVADERYWPYDRRGIDPENNRAALLQTLVFCSKNLGFHEDVLKYAEEFHKLEMEDPMVISAATEASRSLRVSLPTFGPCQRRNFTEFW
eukprot:TRINITY_DN281_c0_g1_i1.p1 TRINITY_DN281_c0_g1~~TRINITY_DN281_c0_g1_i1.p1  ORF type:complete len:1681 (+),score=413.26 TRINITY_DN281_c0_g1_i1:132-5045(+)